MNIEELRKQYQQGKHFKYIFFWGHKKNDNEITSTCFSQWYECTFTADGITYHTAEQYMMAQKARLFGDEAVLAKIMQANHPGENKALGRQIRHFDSAVWDQHKSEIVVNGNLAKFSQNEPLKQYLLQTGNRVLVEASPYDQIWGIGMAKSEPGIGNPLAWKGENRLGFALMEVRDRLNGMQVRTIDSRT